VAGTAEAWQNVDVSLSAGEIVPDRNLSLPPQLAGYSHDLDRNMTGDGRLAYEGWLCRWESMANASAASKPWVTAIKPSTNVRSDYTGWVGMRIQTGESSVWVTRLGRWVLSGNSCSHTVKQPSPDSAEKKS
jgi:hypothetical protein